jgi:predicted  nucleic acid-binding Zn-ribbon protein
MEKKEGEAMEARLAEIGKKIDDLKSRLGTVTGDVKAELSKRIDAAYAAQEEQRQRLHRLKDKGLEQWDALADQAGKAWHGLEKSLQDLASRLKK